MAKTVEASSGHGSTGFKTSEPRSPANEREFVRWTTGMLVGQGADETSERLRTATCNEL